MSCFSNTSSHHNGGDEDRTTRASSSSTSSRQNYEVFLSFRGEDTRYGFTDHLYNRLVDKGIVVFRDNEKLDVGENIDQLFRAIKAARISILIISPNYASSIWCLKELLEILECKETLGQLVLPIFYRVKPSDVREQKGNFGEKFWLCKSEHDLDGKFVKELENGFIKVANMKGWESDKTANGYEGELVKKVVTRIFNELRKAILVVPEFLVGVEDHVKNITKMIDTKPNDAKIIGIYGMGGIGKTTLAKVIYNALCSDFECHSFLPNIREASKNKGMEALQKQIISDVLVDKSLGEISHVDEGITIIEKRFKGKKLLLLLDDIENEDQLNKLVAKNSWFGSDSIVIITTRNKDVTVASTVNLSYQLNELNKDQSYDLFCKHAFGRDASCPRNLETLAKHIVSTADGLPLAIKVIGSLLFQKDENFWKKILEKLKRVPHKEVRDKLKISYDYLDYEQQQIFLDIACIPIRYHEFGHDYASYMWNSCGFYPEEGIERLISLSLIKWDDSNNKITIHDQLRDLGRDIVHKEGCDNIGLCSRICLTKEAIEVMGGNQGTDKVQALVLQTGYRENLSYASEDFGGMTNLRFLQMGDVHLNGDFEKLFLNLKWLCWGTHFGPHSYLIDVMGINFIPKKLVVLELNHSNITENWEGWSHTKDLKVIKLKACMNLTMTPDFSALLLKELEVLILEDCHGLKKVHQSIDKFKKTLKVFKVTRCHEDLRELPIGLGEMEELRELDISYNSFIREIPIFKGYMTKLETLKARTCDLFLYIQDSLGSLVKLQHLDLSETGVKELPDSIGELCNLESLHMEKTPIKFLPTSIGRLSKLKQLDLRKCWELKYLPNLPSSLTSLCFNEHSMETLPDFSNLNNLVELKYMDLFQRRNRALNLGDLNQLKTLTIGERYGWYRQRNFKISYLAEELDVALENFSLQLQLPVSLQNLRVYGCQTLHTLPNFSNFKNLSELSLNGCSELMEISGLGGVESLTELEIRKCKKLSRLGDLSYLKRLRKIELSDCDKLSDVQGIEQLTSLNSLSLSQCPSKFKFPDLSMLVNLKDLLIENEKLMEIPRLQELKSLNNLSICRCVSLQHLPDLSQCTKLKSLYARDLEKLIEIRGLQELKSLESLEISRCSSLQHLPDLSQFTKLKRLHARDLEKLTEIRGLKELKSLESLEISRCRSLQDLPDLSQFTKLKRLHIGGLEKLTEIRGLQELKSLESLAISRCRSLQDLPDLSQFTKLKMLHAGGLEKLTEIQGLQELKSLEFLNISGCRSLQNLPDLSQFTKLESLHVRDFEKLTEIRGLQELKSLGFLDVSGCKSLQHLPDLSQFTKLKWLHAGGLEKLTEIRGLQELKSLESLEISRCRSLQDLPDLSQFTKLKRLHTGGLEKLTEIRGLQELKSLESLEISRCRSSQHLPDLSQFTKMKRLHVGDLEKLTEIRGLQELKSLESLNISGCRSLQHLPDLSQFTKLESLHVGDFEKLTEIRGLQELKSLKWLRISRCRSLQHLSDLSQFTKLESLHVRDLEKLIEIRGLQELKSLEYLGISRCKSLQHLPDLSQFTKLKRLHAGGLEKLTEIRGLQELKSLECLDISGCKSLQHLPDLSQFTKLKILHVGDLEKLTQIRGLQELKSLESLDISGCKSLQHLLDLSQFTKLESLHARDLEKLIEIRGLQELKSLESLDISGCKSLQHLPDLSQFTKLENLHARDLEKLIEIRGFQELKSLEFLDISGCKSLQHLPDLSQCTNLKRLDAQDLEKLTEIKGLENLISLKQLNIKGCSLLSNLPILSNVTIESDKFARKKAIMILVYSKVKKRLKVIWTLLSKMSRCVQPLKK